MPFSESPTFLPRGVVSLNCRISVGCWVHWFLPSTWNPCPREIWNGRAFRKTGSHGKQQGLNGDHTCWSSLLTHWQVIQEHDSYSVLSSVPPYSSVITAIIITLLFRILLCLPLIGWELQPGHQTLPLVLIPIGPPQPLCSFALSHGILTLLFSAYPCLYIFAQIFPCLECPFLFILRDELLITLQGPDGLPWLPCHSIVKSCHLQNWLFSNLCPRGTCHHVSVRSLTAMPWELSPPLNCSCWLHLCSLPPRKAPGTL